jgi:hypothetical protein
VAGRAGDSDHVDRRHRWPLLNNAGIWTYGISGMFHGPEGSGAHLNEHIP